MATRFSRLFCAAFLLLTPLAGEVFAQEEATTTATSTVETAELTQAEIPRWYSIEKISGRIDVDSRGARSTSGFSWRW